MKKLMTTLSAVGVALGLYAATGDISGTSFEQLNAGAYDITQPGNIGSGGEINDPDGDTYWVTNDTATLTIAEGASISGMDNRPAAFEGKPQTRYLDIKTTLGNAVERKVNLNNSASEIGDGLYFDSLVKFTAFEDEDSANSSLSNGGKLAIWLKQDDADNPTVTNLMITAGYLTGNSVVVTNYSCKINGVAANYLNDGGWHRVTVRAINSIYESLGGDAVPGFVVYIDEHRAYTDDINGSTDPRNTKGINVSDLTAAAAYEHTTAKGALFPSAEQGTGGTKTQIRAVAFDGQGSVDDIVFTTTDPFDTTTDFFTIEAGANVVSLTYTDGGSQTGTVYACGKTSIAYTENMTVTINPTYSDGCSADTWTTVDATYTGNVVSPSAAGGSVTVKGVVSSASVIYDDNGTIKTNASATAAAAFEFIKNNGAGSYTVMLDKGSVGSVTLDTADRVVVLDLAGHSITGDTTSAAIAVSAGSLTIIDSVGNGEVTAGSEQNAVRQTGSTSTLVISNGVFNGVISVRTKGLYGGSYSYADNREETEEGSGVYVFASANRVADGYAATKTGDYWVVEEKPVVLSWETILGPAVGGAYEIDDLAELKAFQANVGSLATAGVTFKLTDDIELDAAWEGIGVKGGKDLVNGPNKNIPEYEAGAFCGTFDGQNHTISNFQMENDTDYGGFFNSVNGATISNLKISYKENKLCANSSSTGGDTGATFVGVARNSTLQNLTALATESVTTVSASKDMAGIVGYLMAGSTVDSCTNELNVASLLTAKARKSGGIALITQDGTGTATIRNCKNNGTVTLANAGGQAGGIVGYVGNNTTIIDCENTAAVKVLTVMGSAALTMQGTNKGNATVLSSNVATNGLNFATVDGNVATFVADNALALNGSYKVMADGAAATFAFAEAGTISFDTNLTQNETLNITASDNLVLKDATVAGVVTFTATDATPSEIDPEKDVLAVDVKATDATDATNKVEVAVPAGAASYTDEATYKALFKIEATLKSEGVYTVEITGIKDEVVADVSADAVDALTDSDKDTVTIPAGLYYRISPGASLPITTVSTCQGLSTGSVDKPTITGGDGSKGFYKVELSPKEFPVLPPES